MIKPKIINIPFIGYKTHCYVYGDILNNTPIIVLHGGPGGCVEKYEVLTLLADKGIPVIMYDQLGCGYSRIPKGNFELMNFKTYEDELLNLISFLKLKEYILLGHSWGGMLALDFVLNENPSQLKKLILFSTLPSTKMWNDEHLEMIKQFPKQYYNVIMDDYHQKEVNAHLLKKAVKYFYDQHVGKKTERKYINKRKRFPKTNKEIYEYMWGKSELFGTGTLKEYDLENRLHEIKKPTLILSGKYDESSPTMNKLMNDRINNSRWVLLEHSHHAGYVEEPDIVLKEIELFVRM